MKSLLFVAPLFFAVSASAQFVNIVRNAGFEDVIPNASYGCGPGPTANSTGGPDNLIDLESYWTEAAPWTVPDKRRNLVCNGIGSPDHYCEPGHDAHTGIHSGFTSFLEYICQEFGSSLTQGHYYHVEFYVKSDATPDIAGIRFSTERPEQCLNLNGTHLLDIDGEPHISVPTTLDISNWTLISRTFYADQAYEWMTVGIFRNDHNGGIYWDDFSITDIGAEACRSDARIENGVYYNLGDYVQEASHFILSGYDAGAPTPNGDVVVDNNSRVQYKAGSEVGLLPGFGTKLGAEFGAFIAPCGSSCSPPIVVAGNSATLCGTSSYQLGSPNNNGVALTWSASPSSALAYLDDPTSPAPIFTPPANQLGTIVYTLSVVNSCGMNGNASVTIHFDSNPDPSPSVNLTNINLAIPSFDITFGAHTETITVEILDVSLTTVYASYTYHEGTDFTCCVMPWQLPEMLSPCNPYKIRVTTKNYCFANTAEQIIDWDPRGPAAFISTPNVFTPNGDGINDGFCITFSGATAYTISVQSGSATVFQGSGQILPPMACLWDGSCNQPVNCTGNEVGDGTYFYVITLTACDGSTIDESGFMTVLHGDGRYGSGSENAPAEPPQKTDELAVFPNPASSYVWLDAQLAKAGGVTVQIYNANGTVVYRKQLSDTQELREEVDLTPFAAGVYMVEMVTGNGMKTKKLVVEN